MVRRVPVLGSSCLLRFFLWPILPTTLKCGIPAAWLIITYTSTGRSVNQVRRRRSHGSMQHAILTAKSDNVIPSPTGPDARLR